MTDEVRFSEVISIGMEIEQQDRWRATKNWGDVILVNLWCESSGRAEGAG